MKGCQLYQNMRPSLCLFYKSIHYNHNDHVILYCYYYHHVTLSISTTTGKNTAVSQYAKMSQTSNIPIGKQWMCNVSEEYNFIHLIAVTCSTTVSQACTGMHTVQAGAGILYSTTVSQACPRMPYSTTVS